MTKGKKILGIILSAVVLLFGLIMLIVAFSSPVNFYGTYTSSASFGGDFYTYQHEATANAANNVNNLGYAVEDLGNMLAYGIALLILSFGLISFAYFMTRPVAQPTVIPAVPMSPTATVCTKCGTTLENGQGFCTVCGTPAPVPAASPVQPSVQLPAL